MSKVTEPEEINKSLLSGDSTFKINPSPSTANRQEGDKPTDKEISSTPSVQTESGETTYQVCFIVQLVCIAAIGGFMFGYDTGIISGAQPYFYDDFPDMTSF